MTWIWTATAWTLTAAGVALFLYAAFWDRPGRRGRPARRCRKCWYDLTAIPAEPTREHPITCPECGRKHARSRAMRRTRRHKRWIVISACVLLLGYSARQVPEVQRDGWRSAIPTWILIMLIHQAPTRVADPDLEWQAIAYGHSGELQRMMGELFSRLQGNELSWWHYQAAAVLARTESGRSLCEKAKTRYDGVNPRSVI